MSSFQEFLKKGESETPQDPVASAPVGDSSFGRFLKRGNKSQQLQESFYSGIKMDSNKAIDVVEHSTSFNLPSDLVDRNLDPVRQRAMQQSIDYNKFSVAAPKTSEWISESPYHAAIAKEDIASMGFFERHIGHISQRFNAGADTVELGDAAFADFLGIADKRQLAKIKEIQFRQSQEVDFGIDGFFEGIPGAVSEQVPIYTELVSGGLKYGTIGFLGGGALGLITGPGALATASIGGRLGFRGGMLKETVELETGLAWLEFKDIRDEDTGEQIDPLVARGAAATVGVVNGALELIGIEKIADTLPGLRQFKKEGIKSLLRSPSVKRTLIQGFKNVGVAMTAEGITEGLQELSNIVGSELLTAYQNGELQNASFGSILERIFSEKNMARMLEAGRAGMQAGGGFSAAGQVIDAGGSQINLRTQGLQMRTAAATKQAVQNMGKAVQSSKLFSKAPKAAERFVNKLVEDAPSKSVYIDVEKFTEYYQGKGEDPRTIADRLLGDRGKAYDEALETGQPLEIPVARYATRIATNKEDNDYFSNEVRTAPDATNFREQQEITKQLIEQDEQIAQEQEQQISVEEAAREVRDNVEAQLVETGMAQSSAKTQAQLYESTFRTLGERTGQDPRDLFERYGLSIQRPELGEVDLSIPEEQVFMQDEVDRDNIIDFAKRGREISRRREMDRLREQAEIPADAISKDPEVDRIIKQPVADIERWEFNRLSKRIDELQELTENQDDPEVLGSLESELDAIQNFLQRFRNRVRSREMGFQSGAIDQLVESLSVSPQRAESLIETIVAENDGNTLSLNNNDLLQKAAQIQQRNVVPESELEQRRTAREMATDLEAFVEPDVDPEYVRLEKRLKTKEAKKALKDAQGPNKPPYIKSDLSPFGYFPNFEATAQDGVIGENIVQHGGGGRITMDPFSWVDSKYSTTKRALERSEGPVTINTSSDMVARNDYRDVIPQGSTIRMHMVPRNMAMARALFPGNPSRQRQEMAIKVLRDEGFNVEVVEPSVDQYVKAAGGLAEAKKLTGAKSKKEIARFLNNRLGLQVIQGGKEFFQSSRPEFYSQLERTLDDKIQGKSASVEQVRGLIKDIKPEELKWSRIDEFLKGKKKVNKQELLDFIRGNQIEIREVELSDFGSQPVEMGADTYAIFNEDGEWVESHLSPESAEIAANRYAKEDGQEYQVQEMEWDGEITLVDVDEAIASEGRTKFSQYTLPGGENYREVLFTLPPKLMTREEFAQESRNVGINEDDVIDQKYKEYLDDPGEYISKNENFFSSHFDPPNILAHVRLNDREGPNGERILFVEEIQSDWHQEGRKKGYRDELIREELAGVEKELDALQDELGAAEDSLIKGKRRTANNIIGLREKAIEQGLISQEQINQEDQLIRRIEELRKAERQQNMSVPDAPFRKTWHEFAFKKILRQAVEQGYDTVAWTTGEQQAERYDLSKQVDGITYRKDGENTYEVSAHKDGETLVQQNGRTISELEDIVGKDVAQRIVDGKGNRRTVAGQEVFDLEGENLKVGGEGMKGFYDKIIPSFVNKFTKKWGGKVEDIEIDLGEERINPNRDTELEATLPSEVEVHSLKITDEMRESVMEGMPLFQSDGNTPRGRIRIGANRNISIDLFKKADLSTFLHETGHFYLEVLADLAADPESPQQIKDDFAEALRFLGVESRDQISTEQHETWARSFEAYLREGKAPSAQLRTAFARFKAWLTSIYRKLRDLDVELTDEIRGVFDRLIATDTEIEQVRNEGNLRPLFENPEQFGFNAVEAERYSNSIAEARLAAEEQVTQKVMQEFEKEQDRQQRSQRREVRDRIEGELNQQRRYIALSVLGRGKLPNGEPAPDVFKDLKISKESLLQHYDQEFLKKLPKPFIYTREGGMHVDQVAEFFGYSTGDQMIQEIVNTPKKEAELKRLVDAEMAENYGNEASGGALKQEIIDNIYDDRSTEIMQAELEHMLTEEFATFKKLSRRITRRVPPIAEIRARAEDTIAQKKVRDIRPIVYQRAEAKAMREAQEALLKGNFEAAFDAQKRRMFNHELYRAAVNAQTQVDKTVRYMGRFNNPNTRARLGKAGSDYLEQIDELMSRFNFSRSLSLKAIDRQKSLLQFVQEQEANGEPVNIPEELINEAKRVSYQELTYNELVAVEDTARNIAHLAKTKNELIHAGKVRDFRAVIDEISASIQANHTIRDRPVDKAKGFIDKTGEKFSKANASHIKMEFLFEYLDGEKAGGAVWNALFKPIADAEVAENNMRDDASKRLNDIFSKYDLKERAFWSYEPFEIEGVESPVLKNKWTKQMVFSVALNWGNLENRKALMDGYGWTEQQVQKILDTLTEKDWQTVQEIWDFIDSFWPQIAQQEREMAGLVPEKVEAAEVQTKFGTFKGGYYPLVYDSEISTSQQQLDEKRAINEAFGGNFSRATTRKGHTKERVGSNGKPPMLSMSVLTEHTTNVIHDLTHRRAIVDVLKVVENEQVKSLIESVAGRELYRKIRPWLHDIAKDRRGQPGVWFDSAMFSRLRQGATTVNMGFKFTTAIVQWTGYAVSIKELGAKYSMRGLKNTFGNHGQFMNKWNDMTEMSPFMRDRMKNFDRDVRDTLRRLNVAGTGTGALSVVDAYTSQLHSSYFAMIGWMDMAVSMPTWWGAYEKAMDGAVENIAAGDSQAAIDFADRTVRVTQGSGGIKDLAEIQRGTEAFKTFTMFYSYFSVLYNQFAKTHREYQLTQDVPKLIASLALLWFLPSLMEAFMLGRHPDFEEAEPEEWAEWAILNQLLYPTQTIIGVRDIVNGMDRFGYSPSPAFGGYESLARLGREGITQTTAALTGEEEEFTSSDAKNAFLTVGYFTGIPARQMWLSSEYFYLWLTGEQEPDNFAEGLWRGLVIGKERE